MIRLFNGLSALGFTYDESVALRRISLTLSSWSEAECNGEIERNEETGKPERVSRAYTQGNGPRRAWPVADREAGALRRLAAIMAPHKRRLLAYHQGDPRGYALYIVRRSALPAPSLLITGAGKVWQVGHKGQSPYACTFNSKAAARAFVARENINSNYTRGLAVCA